MKKIERQQLDQSKKTTGYRWEFKNKELQSWFRLRSREYGDRGLASWCLLEPK